MTGTRRNIYINDETSQALKDIGGGNRSKGIQIAGGFHGRLVEALERLHKDSLSSFEYRVSPRCDETERLLTEIAEAGK